MRQPGPIILCVKGKQKTLNFSRAHMTSRCGSASVPFSKSIGRGKANQETQDSVTLPLSVGGLGLRSVLRTSKAAY